MKPIRTAVIIGLVAVSVPIIDMINRTLDSSLGRQHITMADRWYYYTSIIKMIPKIGQKSIDRAAIMTKHYANRSADAYNHQSDAQYSSADAEDELEKKHRHASRN